MRAACLSLSWWRSSVPALLDRDAPDAPLVSYPDALLGAVSQAHWDSPPIAFNLRSAADGFLDHPEFCGVCASALAATRLSERSFSINFPRRRFKFQRELYRNLVLSFYPDDLHVTVLKRFVKYFPLLFPRLFENLFCEMRVFALSFPRAFTQQLLRSCLFSWMTSVRLHEPYQLPCLLGCVNCRDDFAHYVCCPVLASVVSSVDRSLARVVPCCVLEFLTISKRDFAFALLLVVFSLAYPCVRAAHLDSVLSSIWVGNVDSLFSVWRGVAKQCFLNTLARPALASQLRACMLE